MPNDKTIGDFKLHTLSLLVLTSLYSTASKAEDDQTLESIEKIIVIGEKADRTLKDTASSVSVIAEETLRSLQHITISQAVSEIPNVVTLTGSVPDIRGVSGNGSATGFNGVSGGARARVSTLIDGVAEPFMADLTGDSGIWDIEQIEVFRGPQSTNNGRNNLGGLIYIKTKDPSYNWEGAARLGYRNQNQYVDSSVMVSGPLIDEQLAFRFTGQLLNGDSFDNSVIYETHEPGFDLNELKTTRIKAKLLWEPDAVKDFSALVTVSDNHEKGDTGRKYYTANNPWDYIPTGQRYMNTDSTTLSLKLDYTLSDSIAFDLLVAGMDYQWGFDSYDVDITNQQSLTVDEDNLTIDSKMRFGLNNSQFYGFVGLAYFEREQDYQSIGGSIYHGHDESESKALYGEASFVFANGFTLIAGGRVERESQYRDFVMDQASVLDQANTITLPKLVLQYAISNNTTATVSARKGYNGAGGALDWYAGEYYYYDSESVNTFEAGVRSSFNSGNINLSANLFYNDYSDYQATDYNRRISNIDAVTTFGFEAEASAMLTQDFKVNAGLGLMRSEIKDSSPEYEHINGNELSSAPGITANLGASYWFTDALSARASINYVDDYYGEITNSEERLAGNYSVARVSLNYELDNWLINAFINNLTDKQATTVYEPPGRRYPDGYAAIIDPRTVGGSVTYRF
ncbi:TonB-dependent receptor [Pseudoalteromonas piratica]|uniref:TonB-dependent receptor n=1 Tax=Pseudoalteromonas piratica TaxID=1348114 RepID=A0A0A7EJ56_9GAMM|nr:TonB-dependent receptor [Pseudoalteromonas piratica]AIY66017.1 TonB-dependent receptor [Pseudoalteromonas piratica]